MTIIDLHCDVLMKLADGNGKYSFTNSPELDVNFERLKQGGVKLQAFALFVYPSVPSDQQFQAILDQVHYFYSEILAKHPEMKLIRKWSDLPNLKKGEIGAILTLEGVDAIGNDLNKLTTLHALGMRSVGLTWNSANLAADGVAEARNGGLSRFGRSVVEWCNEHSLFVDVSHLSVAGFWEVMELAKYPIASHSNAKAICNHRRNLDDDQIKALIERDMMIHLVFCPPFTKLGGNSTGNTTINDIIRHIKHIVGLGGMNNIGFGSDFDGIESKVSKLSHAGEYQNLIEALLLEFTEAEVSGFAHQNFLDRLPK